MPKKTIAITGASGFLGKHLVKYFLDSGWNVVALVRNPHDFTNQPGVKAYKYDLKNPVSKDLFVGVDALIHAAYIKASRSDNISALDMNIDGARRLYAASHSVKKRLFISSMSAGVSATSIYGRQKFEIEKIFSSENDVIIRPGFIIGDGGLYKNIVSIIKKHHVIPTIGLGKQPLQIISVDDLVKAIASSITASSTHTLTIAHPQPITYKMLFRTICKKDSLAAFFVPLPYFVFYALVSLAPLVITRFSVTNDNLKGLKNLQAVNNSTDMQELGLSLPDINDYLLFTRTKIS